MKRLTTDDPKNNLQTALNLFYAKDGEAWVRGSGPDGQDITLNEYIRQAIRQQIPCSLPGISDLGDAELSEVMCEWAMDGNESLEGWLGTLYTAGWVCAELRARLKKYEDAEQMPQAMTRWIPVTESLPETSLRVIVCRKNGKVEQGEYRGVNGWWKVYGANTKAVTHWMPLPEPPEVQ